eukprot:GFKZ01007984.1.p1 GENE.GFKZ01007984.1~~GFKZ01007984.1.p1  ORF type:complete len:381 (+),score=64.33 GFKZ01007984.1:492-1634(+)
MPPTAIFLFSHLLTLICLTRAHLPGQEFQYLSLFVRPEAPQGYTSSQLRRLSRQYARQSEMGRILNLPNRKLLDVETGKDEVENSKDEDNNMDSRQRSHPEEWTMRQMTDSETNEAEPEDDADASTVDDTEAGAGEDDVEEEEEKNEQERDSAPGQRELLQNTRASLQLKGEAGRPQEEGVLARRNGENVTQLSSMLMKIIRQYNVRSMLDVPCRAHAHWMPGFVRELRRTRGMEGFKYMCVDTNREVLKEMKKRIGDGSMSTKYIMKRFWEDPLPKADLVFSWAGLDNMREGNVVKYVEKLASSRRRHKLVLLGSHSGSLEVKGGQEKIARFTLGGKPINFRKKPFYLAKPMRVVEGVSVAGNDKKLFVYRPDEMVTDL